MLFCHFLDNQHKANPPSAKSQTQATINKGRAAQLLQSKVNANHTMLPTATRRSGKLSTRHKRRRLSSDSGSSKSSFKHVVSANSAESDREDVSIDRDDVPADSEDAPSSSLRSSQESNDASIANSSSDETQQQSTTDVKENDHPNRNKHGSVGKTVGASVAVGLPTETVDEFDDSDDDKEMFELCAAVEAKQTPLKCREGDSSKPTTTTAAAKRVDRVSSALSDTTNKQSETNNYNAQSAIPALSNDRAQSTVSDRSNESTKKSAKQKSSSKVSNKQITLTQMESFKRGNTAKKKEKESFAYPLNVCEIKRGGKKIMFKRGDIWTSSDSEYDGFAFTIGQIDFDSNELLHVTDCVHVWMKLEKTGIGADEAARLIREGNHSEWVLVTKHKLIPPGRKIFLEKLRDRFEKEEDTPYEMKNPMTAVLYEESDSSTFAYYIENGEQLSVPSQKQRPIVLDLFAGGGGMSIGLERAGFNVKYKVDNEPSACDTLEKNFPNTLVYRMSLRRFLEEHKAGQTKIFPSTIVLLHGSPPCQGYSSANTSGGANDIQNCQATFDYVDVIRSIQPPFVSMENVPGSLAEKNIKDTDESRRSYMMRVIGELRLMEYQIRLCKPVACAFGDPQNRERVILLAAKKGYKLPSAPAATHGKHGLEPIVTTGDVLSDLEGIKPVEGGFVELPNGKKVFGHLVEGTALRYKHNDDTRLDKNRPAVTVRKANKLKHYEQDRYVTFLERKRLMSFPDEYVFEGKNRRELCDQIGNAVPVRFAAAVGKAVMSSYMQGLHAPPE